MKNKIELSGITSFCHVWMKNTKEHRPYIQALRWKHCALGQLFCYGTEGIHCFGVQMDGAMYHNNLDGNLHSST